jgi:hypothetical protein
VEFPEPAELRPSLDRAELAALPKECHWPSLMAERIFDELRFDELPADRIADEPRLWPASDPPPRL